MVSILFFIIVILIISILCFLSGRRMAENRAEKNLLYQQEHYDSAERKGDVREPCGMRRDMPGAKAGKPLL